MLGPESPAIRTFQNNPVTSFGKFLNAYLSFGSCQGIDNFNDIVGVVPGVKFCFFFPGFVGGCNVCQDSSLVYTNLLPRRVTVDSCLQLEYERNTPRTA